MSPVMTTNRLPNQNKVRHVPKRTCVACRNIREKKEMIRLVGTDEGIAEPDTTGKRTGRGAYLCRNIECWIEGCRGMRLENALKIRVNQTNKENLISWIKDFLKDNTETK